MANELDNLLVLADRPSELFGQLYRLHCKARVSGEGEADLCEQILALNKQYGLDLCIKAVEAIQQGTPCFDVLHVLEKTWPQFDLKIDSTLKYLEVIYEAVGNDMLNGIQYQPTRTLVTTQFEFAQELLSELIIQEKPFVIHHISSIYEEISKKNIKATHGQLIELTNSSSSFVVEAAIVALCSFDYKSSPSRRLTKPTLSRLNKLLETGTKEVKLRILLCCERILYLGRRVEELIEKTLQEDDPYFGYALSLVLFRATTDHKEREWFRSALLSLSKTSKEDKGTIDNLDFVLCELIKTANGWELAFEFITEWICQSDYKPDNPRIDKLYNSTFFALCENIERLQILLTRFLLHDNPRTHSAAAEVVSFAELRKIDSLKLDRNTLKDCSIDDLVYICRKLFGYVFSAKSLCSMTFSILGKSPRDRKIQGLIQNIFIDQIGDDFPLAVRTFLAQEIKTLRSSNKKMVASNIINQIERRANRRSKLPRLNELCVSSLESQRIRAEDNRKMSQMMAVIEKESVLMSIATRVTLKYGIGSFSREGDSYSTVGKLSSISYSAELPKSERLDKVNATKQRAMFQLSKRGQK